RVGGADADARRRQAGGPTLRRQRALVGMLRARIEAHDAIRTCAHAFLAARAPLDVDRHDSVHTMLADRAGAAGAHAGGALALLAHRLDVFEALGSCGRVSTRMRVRN